MCGGVRSPSVHDVPNNNIFFCSIARPTFRAYEWHDGDHIHPSEPVPRARWRLSSRALSTVVTPGSRRAALKHWWTPAVADTFFGGGLSPQLVESDGEDIWIALEGEEAWRESRTVVVDNFQVFRATNAYGVVVARGLVLSPGLPTQDYCAT